ncbi:MAG: hypothetical protein AABZ58_10210, partial [Chloroflexota bacterium]
MVKPSLPLDQILSGDCVSVLNTLPENSVDLIFADPPYNLQLQQELWRPNMTRVDAVDDAWDQFGSDEDYIRVARKRIDAIQPEPPDPDVFLFENKRTQPRVPFGALLERGLLRPGQKLYFGR